MKSLYLPLFSLLFVGGAALADDGAILNCRALPDSGARLACYDAIPVGARQAAPSPEQGFAIESTRRPEAPASFESAIAGNFSGWGPNSQIRLANGQVWRVADGSSADLAPMLEPKVRIVRNFFGTVFLEIEGTNNSPKVRRVR